jgi:hypothetical protein
VIVELDEPPSLTPELPGPPIIAPVFIKLVIEPQ